MTTFLIILAVVLCACIFYSWLTGIELRAMRQAQREALEDILIIRKEKGKR
jgi:hypothetical protein